MYHVIERKIECSKCNSQKIVKPVNMECKKLWIYKCLGCGHVKDYKSQITVSGSFNLTVGDLKKPIRF